MISNALSGKTDDAITIGKRFLEKREGDSDILFLIGQIYLTKKRYKFASDFFDLAIKYNPKHLPSIGAKAQLYSISTDPTFRNGKLALSLARKACELSK